MQMLTKVFLFYKDGIMGMRLGKKLWLIVFIKVFIILVILRIFFFPNILDTKFTTTQQKSAYVLDSLTNTK